MADIVCKTTCTIPKRGFVSEGEKIQVGSLDIMKHSWLKHFTYNGKPITAAKVLDVPTDKTASEVVAEDAENGLAELEGEEVVILEDGSEQDKQEEAEAIIYPKHVGAGVYELSNGDRVKGKADAARAEAGLSASA